MNVLSLNAGSSSLKVALFSVDETGEKCLARGSVERIGLENGRLALADGDGNVLARSEAPCVDHVRAVQAMFDGMGHASLPAADAFGHRFVHGGPTHSEPALVDRRLRASLDALRHFAPLHLPTELAVLDTATDRYRTTAQVVCFDTAFHHGLPEVAKRFALPEDLLDQGVRRYGFHGLSYEYVVEAIGAKKLGRAVIAHLGSGASMAAVKDGRSVDTTMGLTPTGGLVMGTRSGDLDPGVLVHLMDHQGYDARSLEELLNTRAGLLGVSGTTSDMKLLLEGSAHDPRAALAVEIFCYSARKFVGALTAVLGGIDTLAFTGGIGEHAAAVRAGICSGLAHLGVTLDAARNSRGEPSIAESRSACRVMVVKADEERMIARHVRRLLQPTPAPRMRPSASG